NEIWRRMRKNTHLFRRELKTHAAICRLEKE
ncbi:hypothetical protein TNIN_182731, partial [Trichonephila inaurata madagascariensis]